MQAIFIASSFCIFFNCFNGIVSENSVLPYCLYLPPNILKGTCAILLFCCKAQWDEKLFAPNTFVSSYYSGVHIVSVSQSTKYLSLKYFSYHIYPTLQSLHGNQI